MQSIRMYSKADMAKGHGVLSAHDEQVSLVQNYLSKEFEVIETGNKTCALNHFHTINPEFLWNIFLGKCRGTINIGYVHFLPETLKTVFSCQNQSNGCFTSMYSFSIGKWTNW